MKRIATCVLLAVCLLLFTGCSFLSEDQTDTFTLYYIRSEYMYHSSDSVIVGEPRTIAPQMKIDQLLYLYLAGPVDDSLISPIPKGTELIEIQEYSGLLEITFSDTEKTMTDAQFSLACVCLGKTLMEDPGIIRVTVVSGDRNMTIDRNNYLLTDEVGTTETTKEAIP